MARMPHPVFLALTLTLTFGCGRKPDPRVYPGQVQGTVTLDGKPLDRGTVTFLPTQAEEDGGRAGIARIEPNGDYWIGNATPTKPVGLKPGKYVVTVLAMEPDPTGTGQPIASPRTPLVYAEQGTTPFSATIEPGTNVVNLALRADGNTVNGTAVTR